MNNGNDGLFREQALQALALRHYGEPAAHLPLSLQMLVVAILVGILLAAWLLGKASFTQKETVPGFLVPAAGTTTVLATRDATLAQVLVQPGQYVEEGTPLFRLAADSTLGNGTSSNSVLLAELHSRQATIEQQQTLIKARYSSETRQHTLRFTGNKSRLAALERRKQLQTEQLGFVLEQTRAAQALLAAGQLSRSAYLRALGRSNKESQELAQLEEQFSLLTTDLTDQQATIAQLPTRLASELSHLRLQASANREAILRMSMRQDTMLLASSSGEIAALLKNEGQQVRSGEPLARITPRHTQLLAKLLVPSSAAGFIRTGQTVRLMLDSYPYQQYGVVEGRLQSLSRSMVHPGETAGPVIQHQPAYLATVLLPVESLSAFGEAHRLRPDATLTADIALAELTLLEWLLKPLLAYRGRL